VLSLGILWEVESTDVILKKKIQGTESAVNLNPDGSGLSQL
jgi:hypothetical protein